MDNYLEFAVESSKIHQFERDQPVRSYTDFDGTASNTRASSSTSRSRMSSTTSWSPSIAGSPAQEQSDIDRAIRVGSPLQLVWHAETHNSPTVRTGLSDQHHEKSCPRCRLTEAEARRCRLERRRDQNRESQRKFRARKEAKIKESAGQVAALESYVQFLEQHNSELESSNTVLQQQIDGMYHSGSGFGFPMMNSEKTGLQVDSLEHWNSATPSVMTNLSEDSPDSKDWAPQLFLLEHPSLLACHP